MAWNPTGPKKVFFFIEECELPAESKLVLHKIAKKEFQLCLQLHNEHQFLFISYLVYFIKVSYFWARYVISSIFKEFLAKDRPGVWKLVLCNLKRTT